MDLAFLRSLFSPFAGRVLFAGFSGGADSTAALLCAAAVAEELSFSLVAVHMNHHLRGAESDQEARNAGEFARRRGIPFEEIHLQIPPGGGMEERARSKRIEAWKRLTAEHPGSAVILGHHAGDRAENLLLRLGRGVNLSGAVGLRMRSEVEGVTFLRPLYRWTRQEIETFLKENGITRWAEDSSNREFITPRNVLRNRILPALCELYPGGDKGIIRSLDLWEEDAGFIEEEAKKRLASPRIRESAFWAETHPALLCRMLRFLWESKGLSGAFSAGTLERFQRFLKSEKQGKIPLGEGRNALIFRGNIRFFSSGKAAEPVLWHWQEETQCRIGDWIFSLSPAEKRGGTEGEKIAFFPLETLPEPLLLAFPERGETMIPWGRTKPVSLKEVRVKAHCPAALAPPVLKTAAGEILWFPGIRRAAAFPAGLGGKTGVFSAKKQQK